MLTTPALLGIGEAALAAQASADGNAFRVEVVGAPVVARLDGTVAMFFSIDRWSPGPEPLRLPALSYPVGGWSVSPVRRPPPPAGPYMDDFRGTRKVSKAVQAPPGLAAPMVACPGSVQQPEHECWPSRPARAPRRWVELRPAAWPAVEPLGSYLGCLERPVAPVCPAVPVAGELPPVPVVGLTVVEAAEGCGPAAPRSNEPTKVDGRRSTFCALCVCQPVGPGDCGPAGGGRARWSVVGGDGNFLTTATGYGVGNA